MAPYGEPTTVNEAYTIYLCTIEIDVYYHISFSHNICIGTLMPPVVLVLLHTDYLLFLLAISSWHPEALCSLGLYRH